MKGLRRGPTLRQRELQKWIAVSRGPHIRRAAAAWRASRTAVAADRPHAPALFADPRIRDATAGSRDYGVCA